MGRLSPEKGVHFLLEALAIAGDPPFKLFGEGPQHRELVDQANRLELKNTEFLGFVEKDELLANLAGSRCVVVPSLAEETSSLAASEALGAGRPLIVTSAGALPELASEGRGLVCRPGDPAGLAHAIQKVFGDEQLCRRMSGRGLDFVHRELTVSSHLSALERCYRQAVSG
jgi:glycosyltransferase involved in cell wall biosynthesis